MYATAAALMLHLAIFSAFAAFRLAAPRLSSPPHMITVALDGESDGDSREESPVRPPRGDAARPDQADATLSSRRRFLGDPSPPPAAATPNAFASHAASESARDTDALGPPTASLSSEAPVSPSTLVSSENGDAKTGEPEGDDGNRTENASTTIGAPGPGGRAGGGLTNASETTRRLIPGQLPPYRRAPTHRYPEASRRLNESGLVELKLTVDAAGKPTRVEVTRSSGFSRLDRSAVDDYRAARFAPHRENDAPTPFTVIIPVQYRLSDFQETLPEK